MDKALAVIFNHCVKHNCIYAAGNCYGTYFIIFMLQQHGYETNG